MPRPLAPEAISSPPDHKPCPALLYTFILTFPEKKTPEDEREKKEEGRENKDPEHKDQIASYAPEYVEESFFFLK